MVHPRQRRGPRLREEGQRRLPVLRDGGVRTADPAQVDAQARRRLAIGLGVALAAFVAAALYFAGPSFFRSEEIEGREANIWLDNLANRIELYRSTTGRYPATLRDLVGPYVRETELKDHWGNPYIYSVPGKEGRPFDLTTLGADGKPGGEGRNRDRTWRKR